MHLAGASDPMVCPPVGHTSAPFTTQHVTALECNSAVARPRRCLTPADLTHVHELMPPPETLNPAAGSSAARGRGRRSAKGL